MVGLIVLIRQNLKDMFFAVVSAVTAFSQTSWGFGVFLQDAKIRGIIRASKRTSAVMRIVLVFFFIMFSLKPEKTTPPLFLKGKGMVVSLFKF